jgi:hypothetical protein
MVSEQHKAMVLPLGRLFHQRWDDTIRAEHPRDRRTWWRRLPPASLGLTLRRGLAFALLKLGVRTASASLGAKRAA